MGKGPYRQTGQKIGEMELAVLLSRNADQFISGARKDTAKEDNQMFLKLLRLVSIQTDTRKYLKLLEDGIHKSASSCCFYN